MPRINGKTIWVTGASSGIGEALTYALNEKGCKVLISARRVDELQRVKKNCSNPDKVEILEIDLAAFNDARDKVDIAISKLGHVDMLVNNAGLSQRSLIIDTSISVDKKLMNINYLGTLALTKAILPHFIQNNAGHFVTVSSLMGKFGSPFRSSYCGAKHALHGFFDVLRMEHEKDGIDVTMICPGFVNTNVAKNALTGDGTAQEKNDSRTENGISAELFAKKMIRAIERKKFEAYIGRKEVMGIYVKRFFPRMLHRVILNSKVT